MGKHLTLVLGGARSGKSTYAQNLAASSGLPVLFVATATAGDEEMAQRIRAHKESRPSDWRTLEAPLRVGEAIQGEKAAEWVLLDCITLLASNVLMTFPEPVDEAGYQAALEGEIEDILRVYQAQGGEWVMVSNEVGLGLVPANELGRIYRDGLGRANQQLARAADRVVLMVAGIAVAVKGGEVSL